MIYFVQDGDHGPIKIGCTDQPRHRFSMLKKVCPGMRLLAVLDGGFDVEQGLHRKFVHLRRGKSTKNEWFNPAEDLLEFIRLNGREICESDKSLCVYSWLSKNNHYRLRVAASRLQMSLAAYVSEVLVKHLDSLTNID
jgi:hypothetical protein